MSQATGSPGIYKAMADIMRELGPIGKDKKNKEQGFHYRGIDDVYNALNPLMAKYGVFMLPSAVERQTGEVKTASGKSMECVNVKMEYRFCHADGSYVSCSTFGSGRDLADKATNKAMAIAHKYALFETFCIPTEDAVHDDPDRETPPPAGPSQPPLYSLENIEAVFHTECSSPEEMKSYFSSLKIPDAHPQRKSIVDMMVRVKEQRFPPRRSDGEEITPDQIRAIQTAYSGQKREVRLDNIGEIVGREVMSVKDLSKNEASLVIDHLNKEPF